MEMQLNVPRYGLCTRCVLRTRLSEAHTDAEGVAHCRCGRELVQYQMPAEAETEPSGIPVRHRQYWLEGREDGFWDEHRLVRVPLSRQDRIDVRAARRVYAAGHKVGARLRSAIGFRWARRVAVGTNGRLLREIVRPSTTSATSAAA